MLSALLATLAAFLFLVPTPALATQDETSYIIAQVNEYRQSKGLPPVRTDPNTCNFAGTRAAEISSDFSHTGFYERVKSRTLPYPGYRRVTENLARTYRGYQNVVRMWINSPTHAANMEKDTPLVCVKSSGNFYAYEGWKP